MPELKYLALACLIYLVAHSARSFKYWMIYGDTRLSLRWTFVIFQITAVLGHWTPVLLSESIRLCLLYRLQHNLTRSIAAEVLSRAFDLSVLGFILCFNVDYARYGLSAALLGLFSILLFFAMNQLLAPVKIALLSSAHGRSSVVALRTIDAFQRTVNSIIGGSKNLLSSGFLLTTGIWLLDSLALSFALPPEHPFGGEFFKSLQAWALHSVQALFGPGVPLLPESAAALRQNFQLPQVYCAVFLIGLVSVQRLRSRA